MEECKYSLEDYRSLIFDNKINYIVPESILKIISELSLQVGSPQYIKTPAFKNNTKPASNIIFNAKKKRKPSPTIASSEEWDTIKKSSSNQTPDINNSNQDKIMALLNKLTVANYDKHIGVIIEIVSDISDQTEINNISNKIFEIASTNIFYSDIYAKLCSALVSKFSVFQNTFEEKVKQYTESFAEIECVSAEENYNKFCDTNKTNEKRKAFSTFLINLINNDTISSDKITVFLKELLIKAYVLVSEENKKKHVEEIVENVAVLLNTKTIDNVKIVELDNKTILEFISYMAQCKTADYKSLTNKSIFKFMDIVDKFKK